MTWTPCTELAVGDIIKWVEPIFAPLGRNKNSKPQKLGEQRLIGEITYMKDFIEVYIAKAEKIRSKNSNPLTVKQGDHVRRKKATVLELGQCQKFTGDPATLDI